MAPQKDLQTNYGTAIERQYSLNVEAGWWAEACGTTAVCLREAAIVWNLERGIPSLDSQLMDGTS